MILHIPTLHAADDVVTIAARFEFDSPHPHVPKALWYRFPQEFVQHTTPRADAFAATALLLAMHAGENLDIRAPISPRLAYNLFEYRNIFHTWLPKQFKKVDIRYEQVEPPPAPLKAAGVGAAFSGGTDSFFTLWSHLAQNQALHQARITHGLFIRGFDMRLDGEAAYQGLFRRYAALLESLGLKLIPASTNAYQFAELRIDWAYFNGPPLMGAALLLSPYLQRFYIPAGVPFWDPLPEGSTALTDHLLSTESMEIVNHGASTPRYDKLGMLASWPVTRDHLRVCSRRDLPADTLNCSACHKCYRTMAALASLDLLPKYHTFKPRLTLADYLRWGFQTHLDIGMVTDIRRRASRSGRWGLAIGIQLSILIHRVYKALISTGKRILPADVIVRVKRKVFQSESVQAEKRP